MCSVHFGPVLVLSADFVLFEQLETTKKRTNFYLPEYVQSMALDHVLCALCYLLYVANGIDQPLV